MDHKVRTAEEKVARIAARQHGIVIRAQLLGVGLSPTEIARRVKKGALIPVHRGVYRVGHAAPSTLAAYMAAVLACGEGALLRGRAAAHLHRLLFRGPTCPEVLTPTERRIPGVRTTRSRTKIDPRDATVTRGIPVTTVPRTLCDLAPLLAPDDLAYACHRAGVEHHTTPRQVEAVLARRPTAKCAARLRRVMSGETKVTLSRLEKRFLDLLRAEGLPLPETNKRAGSKRVDCRWPEHKLTVELNSYRFHNSRHSYEQDHRRKREAYARGDEFRDYTWGDVFEQPRVVVGELRALLA